MKQLIFAIFDLKSNMHLNPMFFITKGQAMRALGDMANDKQTIIGQHPEDYQLRCIGTYDVTTGHIEGYDHPEPICMASDHVLTNTIQR